MEPKLIQVPTDKLVFLRRNPQYLTPHEMEALKTSIQRDGFLAPILVRPKGSKFEILSGNHRAMAAQELELKRIPAICADLSDAQAKRLAINLNTVHGNPTVELMVPFLAEMDEEILRTVHLEEKMRKEIAALDQNMAEIFARMEVPDAWNKESPNTEIGQCVCPTCGKRHVRLSGDTRERAGVREGEETA